MKKTVLGLAFAMLLTICANGWADDGTGGAAMTGETRVRITFDGKEAVAAMLDNPQVKDFLAMLPMTVTLEDYAAAEKIYYLPQKLRTQGGRNAEHAQGDFCYFAPWGNLAIFYKGMGYGSSLYVLGRLESGKEALADAGKSFTATIELLQ